MALSLDLAALAAAATAIAREAGGAIMKVYAGPIGATRKADHSPLTEADLAAEAIIVPALQHLAPDLAVISEEGAGPGDRLEGAPDRFWLVDPLDGTKEFIARNGDFTVNIALVQHGVAILGIVHLPALDEIYRGHDGLAEVSRRGGPFTRIRARPQPAGGSVMAISRSHADKELVKVEELGERVATTIVAGSALKFCRVAEGVADIYPRFGPTMEWDTAAGQAVLEAAGGSVTTLDGARLLYGKPGLRNPHFVARGNRAKAGDAHS
jgi:3'(2'), 5'-bisphosphate nucleotidase